MKKLRDWIDEKWHDFKIWFCKDEVDFFLKQNKRLEIVLEEKNKELKFLNQTDTEAINDLNNQLEIFKRARMDMLIVDPKKIVQTDQVIVDELGRPVVKKILTIGGEKLSPEISRILREEAAFVKRTMFWDLVQNTVTNAAKLAMFERSKDFDDMRAGKGILYAADIYKKILDRILE